METLIIDYMKNGVIAPKDRIVIYEWLLSKIIYMKENNLFCYMCNLIQFRYYIDVNINTIKGSELPELARQHPKFSTEGGRLVKRDAWYDAYEYDMRIKNVQDAIALWNKKYKK